MNTLFYFAPLMLVVLSNTIYHLISKTTSTAVNPFAALVATYGIAFLGSMILFLITKKATIVEEISNLKISNYIMGLVIIGLEGGYLLMYQKGWEVSKGSVIANICVAIILLLIGAISFQEKMDLTKVIGIVVCFVGVFLINMG